MKKSIPNIVFLFAMSICGAMKTNAQCNELFISEYVEGTFNNKAIEIYNPTRNSVNLSQYRFTRWQNGSAAWTSQYSDSLYGTLQPNGAIVLVLDRRNPAGTGQDTQVFAGLKAKGQLWLSLDYNTSFSMSFNGDDALSLDKRVNGEWLPVDIFGKIGERPQIPGNGRTIGWSDSFPHNNGKGLWMTIDKTLIRKRSVDRGVKINPAVFNPKTEWTAYPANTFDSLGTHICKCDAYPARLKNSSGEQISIYPNPAKKTVYVQASSSIQNLRILNLQGKIIQEIKLNQATTQFQVDDFAKGIYVIHCNLMNGSVLSKTVIID